MVASLAIAASSGGVALAPGYSEPGPVHAVLIACAVASVVATSLLRRRLNAFLTLLAGLPLPLAGVVATVAWRPGEGPGLWGSAAEAVVHSGARILTSIAPTPPNVDTLTLPLLATWLTGAASVLAWRGRRRTLALLPGLLLLVGAVVLNGPVAPPGFSSIGLLGVAAVLLLSTGSDREPQGNAHKGPRSLAVQVDVPVGRASGPRRALVTGSVVVLTATATAFGGPVLLAGWSAEPGDPRAVMTPPVDPRAALNPLGHLAGWAAEPDDPLLTVTSEGPVELRWVALADFSGTTWLPEGGYRPAGTQLPEPVPPVPGAVETTVDVTVGEDLPGDWAPVVGVPRRIDLPSPGYEPVTGTVVRMDGALAGSSYQVVGDVADWRVADLAGASTPAGEVFDVYRELPPGAPPVLNDVVSAVAREGSPYQRARALADYLREGHFFDPGTPGGHGYANVAAVLAPPGEEGGGGTSEQFASAFAMLARAAGLPSRVAVGFAPPAGHDGGEYVVRTGDAVAWGEVYFEGIGWVPFAVTPGGEDRANASEIPENTAGSDAPEAAANEGASGGDDVHDIAAPRRDPGDGVRWAALGSASGLLALVFAVPVLRLARRGRRLRSGTAEARVLGAWRELRDGLRMCGSAPLPGHTVSDTLGLLSGLLPEGAGDRAGSERLGAAVNSVGFGAGVDGATAAGVTAGVRRHLRALRAGRSWGRRLAWWFDPRPLFWRAR